MAKKKKLFVKLVCSECKEINYYTPKTQAVEGKLELKKYCPRERKHTKHVEKKK